MKEPVGTGASRLAGRIEADPRLANPDQKAADPSRERNPRMRDASARLEHQTGNPAHGNMRSHSGSVDHDERAVQNIEPSFLDEQDGGAILDRDGAGWRDSWRRGHAGQDLVTVMRRLRR